MIQAKPLTELKPSWVQHGGHGIRNREGDLVPVSKGVALGFVCPCGCGELTYIELANPLTGSALQNGMPKLTRVGSDFRTLTIEEQITTVCGWRGFLVDGKMVPLNS